MAASDPDLAVEVCGLVKQFGSFVAVNQISFQVKKGAIYGFLGPNGAGKSTTIRMLCGILAPTSGNGHVGEYNIITQAEKIKNNIGYMSQKFSLYQDLTVEENIDFYSGIYRVPAKTKNKKKEWVLKMAGLTEHRDIKTAVLPAGWKQRLALGCAVLHDPPIIFLDEPTAGVDPVSRREFWNLIYELSNQGVTVFVTTHYMDEAEYFDDIAFIYRGELIANGSPEYLKLTIMQQKVLEIICEDPYEAMSQILNIPEVKEISLFGRSLHAVVEDEENTRKKILRMIETDEKLVPHVEEIEPSLEDVFIYLIEERDKQEAPIKQVER